MEEPRVDMVMILKVSLETTI